MSAGGIRRLTEAPCAPASDFSHQFVLTARLSLGEGAATAVPGLHEFTANHSLYFQILLHYLGINASKTPRREQKVDQLNNCSVQEQNSQIW